MNPVVKLRGPCSLFQWDFTYPCSFVCNLVLPPPRWIRAIYIAYIKYRFRGAKSTSAFLVDLCYMWVFCLSVYFFLISTTKKEENALFRRTADLSPDADYIVKLFLLLTKVFCCSCLFLFLFFR